MQAGEPPLSFCRQERPLSHFGGRREGPPPSFCSGGSPLSPSVCRQPEGRARRAVWGKGTVRQGKAQRRTQAPPQPPPPKRHAGRPRGGRDAPAEARPGSQRGKAEPPGGSRRRGPPAEPAAGDSGPRTRARCPVRPGPTRSGLTRSGPTHRPGRTRSRPHPAAAGPGPRGAARARPVRARPAAARAAVGWSRNRLFVAVGH